MTVPSAQCVVATTDATCEDNDDDDDDEDEGDVAADAGAHADADAPSATVVPLQFQIDTCARPSRRPAFTTRA